MPYNLLHTAITSSFFKKDQFYLDPRLTPGDTDTTPRHTDKRDLLPLVSQGFS